MDIPDETKVCTKCGKRFPATDEFFFRNQRGKYGLRADCKECASEHQRRYLREHGEAGTRADRRVSVGRAANVRHAEERMQEESDDQVNLLILDALLDIERKLDVLLKLQRGAGSEEVGTGR